MVPAAHPCFPGHFPGDPVAPGALLLDEATALLLLHCPGTRLAQVIACKFLLPVRPGDTIDVYRHGGQDDIVKLSCIVGADTILHGTLRLASA